MRYGNEVILRGGRYFDYKRKGLSAPLRGPLTQLLWQFTTLGVYDPKDPDAEENGYIPIGTGNCKELIVSASSEEEAVELLRIELTNESIVYNGSHWDLELIGIDVRKEPTSPILLHAKSIW